MSLQTTRIMTLVALCTAGMWLAGCAEATPQEPASPTPTQQTTATQETSPSSPAPIEPIGEFSTEPQQADHWPEYGDTSDVYPTAVRAAQHDGFERIVIEHAGTGQPSFLAQYTDEPREPGIGTLVDTGAGAYLEVTLSGTSDPLEVPPDMLDHGAQLDQLDTQATQTVVSFAPWEATSTYYVGLDKARPYAITVLEDPVRVVIDIQLDDQ